MTKSSKTSGNGAPAAANASKAAGLRVTSRAEGFRRGGRAWSKTPVVIPAADLTKEQLAQIRAEPMLTVEDIEQ